MRIYEFSKLHNLATKDVLNFLQTQGVDCKSHMAVMTQETITLLEKKYLQKPENPSIHQVESVEKNTPSVSELLPQELTVPSFRKERPPMHEPLVKKTSITQDRKSTRLNSSH